MTTDEILKTIESETEKELNEQNNAIANDFGELAGKKAGIMKRVYMALLTKLIGNLKVKVTIYWNDNVIFEYVIPKN